MGDEVGQGAEESESVERLLQRSLTGAPVEHLLAQALYAGLEMKQSVGHRCQYLAYALREQGRVYLQMETQVGVVLRKEL